MNSEHNNYCGECNTCYVCLEESQSAKFKVSHDILERLKEHVEFHESIDTHKTDAAFLRIVGSEVENLLKENKKMLEAFKQIQEIDYTHDAAAIANEILGQL